MERVTHETPRHESSGRKAGVLFLANALTQMNCRVATSKTQIQIFLSTILRSHRADGSDLTNQGTWLVGWGLLPEGGLEPPQGCPYRILSPSKLSSSDTLQAPTHGFTAFLRPVCALGLCWFLVVWAQ
jgi:hypothetical protein